MAIITTWLVLYYYSTDPNTDYLRKSTYAAAASAAAADKLLSSISSLVFESPRAYDGHETTERLTSKHYPN